jgi:hypothetical protein
VDAWLRAWVVAGGAFLIALTSTRVAHAEGPPVLTVYVAPAACPNAALLRAQLTPLVPGQVELSFDGGERRGPLQPGQARVRDLGEAYAIEAPGAQREVEDSIRDCLERARVAAVFIALNVKPIPKPEPAPPPEPEAEPEPEPEPEPEAEPEAEPDGTRFGLLLFGGLGYAGEIERVAPGGGFGAFVVRDDWRFLVSAALLAPAEFELAESGGERGSVELWRMPASVSAGYRLRAGPFEVGPALGLAVDVLRLRGQGVDDPQTELRANPGFLLAADLHLPFTRRLSASLRLGLSWFPRAYDLSLEPGGRVGQTPRLWFGGHLGLGFEL